MTNQGWSEQDIKRLKSLHAEEKYFFSEIAKKIGKRPAAVRWKAKKLGLKLQPSVKKRYGYWNSKHAHLREAVFKYFLTHSWEETKTRFSLSESELKSLFTVGYKDPRLAHLRKETRRHDSWDIKEIKFLLQNAGIRPRKWISKKLKRGGVHAVKESLNRLNCSSKHMNGMPYTWAQVLFQDVRLPAGIKTKAGPPGGKRGDFRFKIIPWVQCEKIIEKHPKATSGDVQSMIRSMAMFQRWIFGSESSAYIVRRIKNQLKGK